MCYVVILHMHSLLLSSISSFITQSPFLLPMCKAAGQSILAQGDPCAFPLNSLSLVPYVAHYFRRECKLLEKSLSPSQCCLLCMKGSKVLALKLGQYCFTDGYLRVPCYPNSLKHMGKWMACSSFLCIEYCRGSRQADVIKSPYNTIARQPHSCGRIHMVCREA